MPPMTFFALIAAVLLMAAATVALFAGSPLLSGAGMAIAIVVLLGLRLALARR